MNSDSQDSQVPTMDNAGLQQRLAGEDFVLSATSPILQHLLVNRDEALFSDEVIARVRGLTANIAYQLLLARALAAGEPDPAASAIAGQDALARRLVEDEEFIAHVHTQTLEAQLAESMRQRSGVDHVLSPLLQHLAASPDEKTAALAIRTIAAQARFIQQMRRMEMPLSELPGDLFHKALLAMRERDNGSDGSARAEAELRASYDEANSRLGQLSRLVMSLGRDAMRALAVDHAGLALFTTSLAMASGQQRNLVILTLGNNQCARLAVTLRAAGLRKEAVEEQFLYFHPDMHLPEGTVSLTTDSAARLLAEVQMEGQQ